MKNLLYIKNTPVLILFIICMAFGFDAQASEKDSVPNLTNEHLVTAQVDRLTRELTLNKKQAKEIEKILKKRIQAMELADKTNRLSENQIKKMNDNAKIQLVNVLTPEQRALYNRINAELYRQKEKYYANKKQSEVTVEDRMLNIE